jgi:hypothetical protein
MKEGDMIVSRLVGDFVDPGGHRAVAKFIGKVIVDSTNNVGCVGCNVATWVEATMDSCHGASDGGIGADGALLGHYVGCFVVAVLLSPWNKCGSIPVVVQDSAK